MAQPPLFPVPEDPPTPKRVVLAGLDPSEHQYVRVAAQRIAAIPDLSQLEAALAEVERREFKSVLTLVVSGLAVRIARMRQLLERQDALGALPEDIRERVKPYVRSFYATKPWERRKRSNRYRDE